MEKIHVVTASLLIAIAAAIGTYAVTRTTKLGVQSRGGASQGSINQWTGELTAANAALTRALAAKPPPLPPAGQRIRYVPPQRIVVTVRVPSPAQVTAIRREEGGRGD